MDRHYLRLALPGPAASRWPILSVTLGWLLLHLIILMPGYPPAVGIAAFLRLPLELPVVILALCLLRGTAFTLLRSLVVTIAALLVLLRLANLGSQLAFGRSFNPLLEMHLIVDGWNLASGAIGRPQALLLIGSALLVLFGLCWLLYRCLGAIARLHSDTRRRLGITASMLLVIGIAGMLTERVTHTDLHVQAKLSSEVTGRIESMQRSIADLKAFTRSLPDDPLSAGPPPRFSSLQGRDVLVIFIESYGRSFLDEPLFATAARSRLTAVQDTIGKAGLHVKSGWVRSSVTGGRSWLTHATMMSGMRITNQARFDRLTVSSRVSLNRLFGNAGWRTLAAMPAIRFDWPEGQWYGFDDIRDANTLGYKGLNFDWVTMPDQYVLSTFERTLRHPVARTAAAGPETTSVTADARVASALLSPVSDTGNQAGPVDDRPVMATLALISSHAPWTPLPYPIDWDRIGDGAVFDGSHRFGGTPSELWRDRDRVREHYALSLDYSLDIVGQYLARYADDALVVVLGDHQPASVIVPMQATLDVPLHVYARDQALLERLPADLFSDGMLPAGSLPSQPLESLRELFSRRFEATPVAASVH